jgi:hypothetical protein
VTELDAGCTPGLYFRTDVRDVDVVWLVLFASVLYDGRAAIERKAAEWRALFGGDRG